MSLRELPAAFGRLAVRSNKAGSSMASAASSRRCLSSTAAAQKASFPDIEDSSLSKGGPSEDVVKSFNPIAQAKSRKQQLPSSRYQFRSPKYYRGPLHPHQPPPASDPSSREYVPGPFNLPRMRQTYDTTVAQDLMTLTYLHKEPGYTPPPKEPRLREWDDSSPYHKNRPKRGPRGNKPLRLIEHNITWQNIPAIERIVVHAMVKDQLEKTGPLHVAGMQLQAITGARPEVHKSTKHSTFGMRPDKSVALTAKIEGAAAWEFLDKCINIVFPRIKDWPGVKGSSGDNSGNISFGITKDAAALFPELEVNYDMYPPNMITGFHVTVQTTARSDRHARLLLSSLGVPFYGEYVN